MLEETEYTIGAEARCSDGACGKVSRIIIDPANRTVTHLKEGHLWGRREVAIPVSAISNLRNGVVLSITKKEVADLPPLSR